MILQSFDQIVGKDLFLRVLLVEPVQEKIGKRHDIVDPFG